MRMLPIRPPARGCRGEVKGFPKLRVCLIGQAAGFGASISGDVKDGRFSGVIHVPLRVHSWRAPLNPPPVDELMANSPANLYGDLVGTRRRKSGSTAIGIRPSSSSLRTN